MRSFRKILVPVLSSAMILSLITGCGEKDNSEEAQETVVTVETGKPSIKDISISYNFSGTVEANDVVNVIPKVAGEVIEKHFSVGDHVNEGDLLFRIDDTSAQITLKQAEAGLTQARAGLNSQVAAQASTYASATETLGKISTNKQQLGVAVDSAYATAVQANAARDNANVNSEYYDEAYENAKSAVEDITKAKDAAKAALDKAIRDGDEEEIAAAQTQYEKMDSALKTAESNRDQAELAKKSGANNARSAEAQAYVAQENVGIAVKNKQDYETYTVNSTLYGANAQMVGADAALTNSKAGVTQAEANVENAKLALDYTQVSAPVSGTITQINVSEHNMAGQQAPAYVIQSDAKAKIVFYVAEETMKFISPGNSAVVTKNGKEYDAVIKNVENTIDQASGLFKVEAEPTGNGSELISGSLVNIKTITRESKNAVAVPINCVYYDGSQAYVFVAENGFAKKVNVVTGLSDDTDMQITEGISAEDSVILTYSSELKDGVKLKFNN
ncbi:MAG: efflux RND transporter periplasmic adaptor subunit [Lachnospiraceae bacterium]|nr:efflux RND transporter periplasmic adaptor subunit [Lachnospiraceae bacterium]